MNLICLTLTSRFLVNILLREYGLPLLKIQFNDFIILTLIIVEINTILYFSLNSFIFSLLITRC